MNTRALVAVIACRNNGSRLYGKPMQNLDVSSGWKVLDQVIANLSNIHLIDEVVLAISHGSASHCFVDYANAHGLRFVVGDENDVLGRLLEGLKLSHATDLFRVTSESPFLYIPAVNNAWKSHLAGCADATFMDGIIDGCGFEILTLNSLQLSWDQGSERHRSELCTLFIRENRDRFNILQLPEPYSLCRKDLRLTVDNPEDLIVCRAVFNYLCQSQSLPNYELLDIIKFLDRNPDLIKLIAPFAEEGYKTMYI